MVIAEGGRLELVSRMLGGAEDLFGLGQRLVLIIVAVLGIDHDRPARRKDGMVDVEVVGFEVITTKKRCDGKGLAIGKVESGP